MNSKGNVKAKQPVIGDVFLMKFNGIGNEQKGWRPGIVFQNDLGNLYSPNIVALPLTTSIKKSEQPTHVFIPADGTGLIKDSMVLCENPKCMSKDRIGEYLTTIPAIYMRKIAEASILASSAIAFIKIEDLAQLWEKAVLLNRSAVCHG